MRDIKFKCYVRFLQEMHDVKELRRDGSVVTNGYDYAIESDAIDLMQFTGLKDINGVEIYEGDIVIDSEFITKRGYPVEHGSFDAQVQGSVCEVICIGFHVDGSPLNPTGEYKVIGNICENPELLK